VLVNWPSIRDILFLYTRAQSLIFCLTYFTLLKSTA